MRVYHKEGGSMSLSLNPWVALVFGVVIGGLLEWLFESWFFRRRRLDRQRSLTDVQAKLQARAIELRQARSHAGPIEVDLASPKEAPPRAMAGAPRVTVGSQQVKVPASDLEWPGVSPAAPRVEAELPAAPEPTTAEADAEAANIPVDRPDLPAEIPSVEIPTADAETEAPPAEVGPWNAQVGRPASSAAAADAAAELPEAGVQAPVTGEVLPEAGIEGIQPGPQPAQGDDLTAVKGIGPAFAAQLMAAGITSFSALASAEPERLQTILNLPAWRQTDFSAWIAEARVLASAPRSVFAGDDLTRLEGIGPVYASKLRDAGITTFAQLAACDEERLAGIIQEQAWRRVNYSEWIEQARLAAAGDEVGQ